MADRSGSLTAHNDTQSGFFLQKHWRQDIFCSFPGCEWNSKFLRVPCFSFVCHSRLKCNWFCSSYSSSLITLQKKQRLCDDVQRGLGFTDGVNIPFLYTETQAQVTLTEETARLFQNIHIESFSCCWWIYVKCQLSHERSSGLWNKIKVKIPYLWHVYKPKTIEMHYRALLQSLADTPTQALAILHLEPNFTLGSPNTSRVANTSIILIECHGIDLWISANPLGYLTKHNNEVKFNLLTLLKLWPPQSTASFYRRPNLWTALANAWAVN